MGRLVLGHGIGRISIDLSVLSEDPLPTRPGSQQDKRLSDDEGWVCGPKVWVGSVRLMSGSERPWENVQTALRHKRLNKLEVFCALREIERFGPPVDQFRKICVQETALSERWTKFLSTKSTFKLS
jgi:hypothetical protein